MLVSDNGEGISRENIESLGKPLFSRKKTGTGIGLALSNVIAKKLRGEIEVRSQEGVGTTFLVRLPAPVVASQVLKVKSRV
jgi:signal transduction histidine kinase